MVEVGDEVWGLDITLILPRILFVAIPLPLDEELQVVCLHLTAQHLHNFKMFFTLMKNRWGQWSCLSIGNWVWGSGGQLDNWEDGMEVAQEFQKVKVVGLWPHPAFNDISVKGTTCFPLQKHLGVFLTPTSDTFSILWTPTTSEFQRCFKALPFPSPFQQSPTLPCTPSTLTLCLTLPPKAALRPPPPLKVTRRPLWTPHPLLQTPL